MHGYQLGPGPGLAPPPALGMALGVPPGVLLPGMGAPAGLVVPSAPPAAHGVQDPLRAMMMMQNQDVVAQFTRQAAEAYDQAKSAELEPEVAELAEHFDIEDRCARALNEQMKRRRDTFDGDLQALWDILQGARKPSGLLMVKVREMENGTFRGLAVPGGDLGQFCKKFKLDHQASCKLAEVMSKRDDPSGDMAKIAKHLERSNKPSALMMLMLKDLRLGKPVKDPEHQAAVGSIHHEKEIKKERKDKQSRSRDRKGRERDRSRQRYRSRSRDRRRSRGR